jgi:hypothetical protein
MNFATGNCYSDLHNRSHKKRAAWTLQQAIVIQIFTIDLVLGKKYCSSAQLGDPWYSYDYSEINRILWNLIRKDAPKQALGKKIRGQEHYNIASRTFYRRTMADKYMWERTKALTNVPMMCVAWLALYFHISAFSVPPSPTLSVTTHKKITYNLKPYLSTPSYK